MQLNRRSHIVQYWKRVTWWMDDDRRTKTLTDGMSSCAFVSGIAVGTTTIALFWMVVAGSAIPIAWMTTALVIVCAACIGLVPVGWDECCRERRDRWVFPAVGLRYEDRLHLTIRGKRLYPYHALAVIVLVVIGYACVWLWTVGVSSAAAQFHTAHPALSSLLLLIGAMLAMGLALIAIGFGLHAAWCAVRAIRICPRIKFV